MTTPDSPTFKQAQEWTRRCQRMLVPFYPEKIGDFLVQYPDRHKHLRFTYQNSDHKDTRSTDTSVTVNLEESTSMPRGLIARSSVVTITKLNSLVVKLPDSEKRILYAGSIDEDDGRSENNIYPSVQHSWKSDTGRVYLVKVDLSEDTRVQYTSNGPEYIFASQGDPELLANIPENIVDLAVVIKRPIILEIDYEKWAQQILKASQLEKFYTTCRVEDLGKFFN